MTAPRPRPKTTQRLLLRPRRRKDAEGRRHDGGDRGCSTVRKSRVWQPRRDAAETESEAKTPAEPQGGDTMASADVAGNPVPRKT